jgi:hypothetical protein
MSIVSLCIVVDTPSVNRPIASRFVGDKSLRSRIIGTAFSIAPCPKLIRSWLRFSAKGDSKAVMRQMSLHLRGIPRLTVQQRDQ